MATYQSESAKGGTTGTLEECIAWQVEHQAAVADLYLLGLEGGPLLVADVGRLAIEAPENGDDAEAMMRRNLERVQREIDRALTP